MVIFLLQRNGENTPILQYFYYSTLYIVLQVNINFLNALVIMEQLSQGKNEDVFEDPGDGNILSSSPQIVSVDVPVTKLTEDDEICIDNLQTDKSFEIFQQKIFKAPPNGYNAFSHSSLKARVSLLFQEYSEIKNEISQLIKVEQYH